MRKQSCIQGQIPIFTLTLVLISVLAACEYPDTSGGIGCDTSELITAINDANANPDPDTIILGDACLYSLTDIDNLYDREGLETGEDGANGLPVISTPITIEGNDSRIVRAATTPGTPEFRIFYVGPGGDLTLNDTYVEMGLVQSANRSNNGGAIYVRSGSLTLNQSHVMNSTAAGWGGGIYITMGTLTSNNTSISFNDASSGGAIASFMGTVDLFGYSVLGNNTAVEYGGAIANGGSMTIEGSRFDNNQALLGGAIACPGAGSGQGDLNLDDVLVNSNIAELDGGGLYLGEGCSFYIADTHFTLNQANTGLGGAIYNKTTGAILAGSRIDNNSSPLMGGGIYNSLTGDLHLDASTLRDNTAIAGSGGAIANFGSMLVRSNTIDRNIAGSGGGIFNTGIMYVENSTLSHNEGTGLVATPVWLNTALGETDPFTSIVNSTFSGNQGDLHAGIYIRGRGGISLSTIVNNTCNAVGCGVQFALDQGDIQIKNSLVVNNNPSDCYFGAGPYGNIALGENLDSDTSCIGFTNSVVPMIGPLADNGGPTFTHALLPGSPALNLVTDCTTFLHIPIAKDQRGELRPSPPGGQCDVGAFEAQSPALPPLPTGTPTQEVPPEPTPMEPIPTPTCPVGSSC
jgi:predicted outer membrane repeat protein